MAHPVFRLERVARPAFFSRISLSSARTVHGVAGELLSWVREQCLTHYQLVEPVARAQAPQTSLQGLQGGLAPETFAPTSPTAAQADPPKRPQLRVVMVHDAKTQTQTKDGATRMVISGRMADVCAELDRLAA